jgi:signal transduction histidine kinase
MRALFAPWGRKSTYVRLFYLLLALPLATAYLVGVVVGLAAGIALVSAWVGIPILLAVAVGWRAVARFERSVDIALLDAAIEPTPPALPDGASIWGRVKALAREPFTWTSLVWLVARFPLAIASFVTVVVVAGFAAAGLTAPLTIVFTERIELWSGMFLDRPVETWPLVVAGLVALVAFPHVVDGWAWVHARGAEKLLNPTARQRALQLQRRTTVLEERTRLAQELHDAVGHTITAVTVQAGAAGHVFDDDPEFARRALGDIETSGRRALGELDRILGILRDDESADRQPAPGLDEIKTLIDDARGAGLTIDLTLTGSPDMVPNEQGRALYRILQEALTNVMKHAGPVETTVTLAIGADAVVLRVNNAAPSEPRTTQEPVPGSQRGLIGVEERVAAYRGTLEHHPTSEGGYQVEVVLPLPAPSS